MKRGSHILSVGGTASCIICKAGYLVVVALISTLVVLSFLCLVILADSQVVFLEFPSVE